MAGRLNPERTRSVQLAINFHIIDENRKVAVTIKNCVANLNLGMETEKADLTIRLSRADVNDMAFGREDWYQISASNDIEVTGRSGFVRDLFEFT